MEKSVNDITVDVPISLESLRQTAEIKDNVHMYSPLSLAYIGDSVLDLLVKTYFVTNINKQTYKYHKEVSNIVMATSQAAFIDLVMDELTEEEMEIYKRGRNATTHSRAKNATRSEYRKATGFESLCGYLYLKNDMSRLQYFTDRLIKSHVTA